ncbi:pyrroline-5-carboxylate reductase [Demequina oxidasica]|uniref:pyrroline-5-carboxylate reductase n=1 Tax=Demequina oxidasica TaxID=676199 RepID=UPI00078422FA|nr:pyrroline-5-carboxylate reductase [Demequina oxidasica]
MSDTATNTAPNAPRIAILGGGVMGGTIITALRVAGWPADKIVVADRGSVRAAALQEAHGIDATQEIAPAVDGADIVVIAVKPQQAGDIMGEIADNLRDGALVITVAAGLSSGYYEQRLPEGTPVVRAMPNTPSIVARGVTGIAAGKHADQAHLDLVAGMLSATGMVVGIEESQMDALSSVSGSGPAYFYAMVEALTEAGVAQGLDRDLAVALATQTFIGAAHLLQETGDEPQELRRRVSSPKGITIAALEAMENAGLQGVVAAGANAAVARSRALGVELSQD